MSTFPPPYAPREHAQVLAQQPASTTPSDPPLEYSESTSTCLEWRMTGLKAMYDSTRGDAKSKCIKSAVFGDADNLWEVLWYANSGVQNGDSASLYLSCVPTRQERDQSLGGKWTRKGLWWFRFEIKSLIPDDRTGKVITLATKDASDHTFAVKTANWGWQQFAKRDALFMHPTVQYADGFVICCTIQAQPQPPAGYWLGMGIPPTMVVSANTAVNGKNVGSGGGLSAWAGGNGASKGVAGGVTAGGGVKTVVPQKLVSSIGSLLDDPLYSDVEFVFPNRSSSSGQNRHKRIYVNKKLLLRYHYFEALLQGGFSEGQGTNDSDIEDEDDLDMLSDSDVEDERDDLGMATPGSGYNLTTTTSRASEHVEPPEDPSQPDPIPHGGDAEDVTPMDNAPQRVEGGNGLTGGEHEEPPHELVKIKQEKESRAATPREATPVPRPELNALLLGPKKHRVIIRDAAWSTWWAIMYWIYTDTIVFAPLSSTFITNTPSAPTHSRNASNASFHTASDQPGRKDWIRQWLDEHNIGDGTTEDPVGPRPVSAKAIYRLADKLDLPELKLRAFQHTCSQLTAANIPAEVFSRFSSTFEDVRKVQVAFFLKHWAEIKKSDTMQQIWTQIRGGKHVGFEEVWPLIVGQLEFRQS